MLHALALIVALATDVPPAQTYHTYIRPQFESFGTAGTLTLRYTRDGYVSGTYRSESGGGGPLTVTGGWHGREVWLDIPTLGRLHVESHFEGTKLAGLASVEGPSTTLYVFTAEPERQ